jgi:protein SCO1/2
LRNRGVGIGLVYVFLSLHFLSITSTTLHPQTMTLTGLGPHQTKPLHHHPPLLSLHLPPITKAKLTPPPQPFSYRAGLLFLLSGTSLILYFRYEKSRMERLRIAEAAKGVGKPKVGGPFVLLDQNGKEFDSERDMRGRYALVYFGFSHCPDICPEELDKLAVMVDLVNASPVMQGLGAGSGSGGKGGGEGKDKGKLLPLFITCDPARDTPGVLKTYLSEFHPDIVGLTGTWEEIKDVCKKYRVYFSTPPGVKKGEDYLVDHSIYFYLMDPEGDFVEAIGRQHSPAQAAGIILGHVGDWKS